MKALYEKAYGEIIFRFVAYCERSCPEVASSCQMAIVSRKALGSPTFPSCPYGREVLSQARRIRSFPIREDEDRRDKPDSTRTYDIYLAFSYVSSFMVSLLPSCIARNKDLVPRPDVYWAPAKIAQSRSLACFSNTQAPNRVHHIQLRHPSA